LLAEWRAIVRFQLLLRKKWALITGFLANLRGGRIDLSLKVSDLPKDGPGHHVYRAIGFRKEEGAPRFLCLPAEPKMLETLQV
jgi:hypothetical protein